MSYFATNATEESLKIIARQMWIENRRKVLIDLYNAGGITQEEYVKSLKELSKLL